MVPQEAHVGHRSRPGAWQPRYHHSSDPLGDSLLLVPATLPSAVLKVWVPKEDPFLPGDTAGVPPNYMLQLLPAHI